MKQKVKMLKTLDGVDEGRIYPTTYLEGEEYDVGAGLLECFVSLGGVELVGLKPRKLTPSEKLVEGDLPEGSTAQPDETADHRETKVEAPAETKPAKPAKAKK